MDQAERLRKHQAIQQRNQQSLLPDQNSILRQLELLRSTQEKKRQVTVQLWPGIEAEDFGGEVRANGAGAYLFLTNDMPLEPGIHGSNNCSPAASLAALIELLKGKKLDLSTREILFLDTETTGLSGGAGTYVFLVGVGHWLTEGFRIEQFFMRDYHEERAMLTAVADRLAHAKAVVTFNGKAFDLPLLESRFVLTRLPWPLRDAAHLDLLHPSRRLWKLRLGDCSLGNLEREILGIRRENDVPGQLIPALYFNYTRTRIPRGIRAILEHNRQDIATLAVLSHCVCRVLAGVGGAPALAGEDLLSAGRYFRDLGRRQLSLEFSQAALEKELPQELRLEAMERLASLYKSEGLHVQAVTLWEQAVSCSSNLREESCEHLAIHYEHKDKNLHRALELVDRVLGGLLSEERHSSRLERWAHRKQRLVKKIQREDSQGITPDFFSSNPRIP